MSTHYSGSEEEIRALDAYIKLTRSVQAVKSRIDQHQTGANMSESQFGVLEALYHLGPLSQKLIGEKLLYSKSNIVAIIDALEEIGLVRRQRDTQDRRFIHVNITAKGTDLIRQLLPKHVAAITEEFSCLTSEEQDQLARLCRKLGLNDREQD
jgi:MarR family 2-MHQ and catechol resistance regulon transcriptional repressor